MPINYARFIALIVNHLRFLVDFGSVRFRIICCPVSIKYARESVFYSNLINMSHQLSNLIIPQHLSPGDKIATVSLSWGGAGDPKFQPRYQQGKAALENSLGLSVVEMDNTLKGSAYLAENIQARVDDLHQAFQDPSIRAIISCVGGDDSIRLVDRIDFDLLRKNPKIFIGFSDSTITHFVCLKAGLRSYYGPSVLTNLATDGGPHPYMIDSIRKTLFQQATIGPLTHSASGWSYEDRNWAMPPDEQINMEIFPPLPWKFIQGQSPVSGRLLGGCTDAFPTINDTSIWPDHSCWDGAVLFLENFGGPLSPEAFLAILRNLGDQGILGRINGILFGRPDRVPVNQFGEYEDLLIKTAREYNRPDLTIVSRMDFGHTDPVLLLPYGAKVHIDPAQQKVSIEESGCV